MARFPRGSACVLVCSIAVACGFGGVCVCPPMASNVEDSSDMSVSWAPLEEQFMTQYIESFKQEEPAPMEVALNKLYQDHYDSFEGGSTNIFVSVLFFSYPPSQFPPRFPEGLMALEKISNKPFIWGPGGKLIERGDAPPFLCGMTILRTKDNAISRPIAQMIIISPLCGGNGGTRQIVRALAFYYGHDGNKWLLTETVILPRVDRNRRQSATQQDK